jgi:DNA (cytosine-5)-methyltransferase 1
MSIRALSLFSGCGGSDLALKELGIDVVWANDIWETACQTYEDNLPDATVECGDIREFTQFSEADLLVGCYPCQGFTQGGRRDWGESINFLYRQFDRVLRKTKPKAFIVENVVGMSFGANRELLAAQLTRYRLAGYSVKWHILHAQEHGVAQFRRRIFIVGVRSDIKDFRYEFPVASHGIPGSPFKSQRKAIGDLGKPEAGSFNDEPLHWYYLSRKRRNDWAEPSPCIVGHWRHIPLHPDSPPLERVGPDEWKFSKKGKVRRLSYIECAALQGFPDVFGWTRGTVRDRFQMIGNAVPPPLFKAVAQNLLEVLT